MKRTANLCTCLLILIALSACASRAPDIRGRWKSVNEYAEATRAIPLQQTYLFHPSPMDRTLKTMLTRWAKDSSMTLSYLHPTDFTLHTPVAAIRTPDLGQALSLLNAAYADQRVDISVDGGRIVVRPAGAAQASDANESTTAAMSPTP